MGSKLAQESASVCVWLCAARWEIRVRLRGTLRCVDSFAPGAEIARCVPACRKFVWEIGRAITGRFRERQVANCGWWRDGHYPALLRAVVQRRLCRCKKWALLDGAGMCPRGPPRVLCLRDEFANEVSLGQTAVGTPRNCVNNVSCGCLSLARLDTDVTGGLTLSPGGVLWSFRMPARWLNQPNLSVAEKSPFLVFVKPPFRREGPLKGTDDPNQPKGFFKRSPTWFRLDALVLNNNPSNVWSFF